VCLQGFIYLFLHRPEQISEGSGYVRQVGDHYIGARWVNRYYYSGPVWQSFVHAPIAETPNANYLYRELKNTPERQIRSLLISLFTLRLCQLS
jgi:hypothetical protein